MKIIPEQLKNIDSQIQLLDVRLPEVFEAAHLTGAKNNCVLEVEFLSRLEATAPDPEAMTVLYGPDDTNQEASVAFKKLTKKGYSDLHILAGGFEAAKNILPIETGEPLPAPPPAPNGRFSIDLEESRCEWTGRNLVNKHTGTVAITSGHLDFNNGTLSGGEIILDLKKMKCSDLEGSDLHQVLIDHLHSDDFFDVEKFPHVTVSLDNLKEGNATAQVTMKGVTHQVSIPTRGGLNEDGLPVAQASCCIDRTKWGVIYGSKKFFHKLAGHFVHDDIELDLRIVTKR